MDPARDPGAGRGWLLAIGLACLGAVGAALYAQHVLDMRPCPWCILQRLLFLVVAAVALLGAALRRPLRRVAAGVVLPLAVAGVTAAVYQHEVASKQYSCALTFADQLLGALGVEQLWPAVFGVTATCAEAAVSLLGVPFEYWSLALFVLVGAAALRVMLAPRDARRLPSAR